MADDLDRRCVNAIRVLAVDAVEAAGAGHPGMPMGAAPMAYVLWTRFLRHYPGNPAWPDRDRFVLSAGHGSMLLYALLYLSGYDLGLEDLRRFRRLGSRTPGHPEFGHTPGVEATTGPLGQGFANGVGMAIAERVLAGRFNVPGEEPIVDHHVYAIVSDGDLEEGVAAEAASLAGHLRLGKLVYLYDDNRISIEGPTSLAFTEDVGRRFEAYGWHVQAVEDGTDLDAIEAAIRAAREETERPSLIRVRTHLAEGSPNRRDDPAAHGNPLGPEEARRTRENLGWPADSAFLVPEEVLDRFRAAGARGAEREAEWRARFEAYRRRHPALARAFEDALARRLPADLAARLPRFQVGERVATRAASGRVIQVLKEAVPELVGGSADLAPSTETYMAGEPDVTPGSAGGRNLHFGVREHAMAAALNGMAYHGGVRPFGATFLVFSDYLRGAMRVSALARLPVVYVFTHDSIALGEDGPTHQPVEHLASLRAMPGLTVIRPADGPETAAAWLLALESDGPVALVLTRQKVEVLAREEGADPLEGVRRGAYVVAGAGEPADLLLLATGSEVALAMAARALLAREGVRARVVSMPSWELFEAQDEAYRRRVLPPHITARLAVELASPFGWERYVGERGRVLGVDRFGASGSLEEILPAFGFTPERVAQAARRLMATVGG
ncbi:MAG: transketolase [Firmicutes bacterium]|nr:transketolase [Bacillota bacterium]